MTAGMVDRRTIVAHLQRMLVPFLDATAVDERLARVEAAGVLDACRADGSFDAVATLNACLYEHPAFVEERETCAIAADEAWLDRVDADGARGAATYRVTQRVRIAGAQLPERSVVRLFLPAPREIPGVQRVRLVAATPARLADHVLARAGQIYAAPITVEAGLSIPELELVYEVELVGAPYRCGPIAAEGAASSPEAMQWAGAHAAGARGIALVAGLVDALEDELQFALTGRVDAPVRALLAAGAGDVAMHAQLLVEALRSRGVAARLGAAQPLHAGEHGRSELHYAGSAAYEHPFVEWRDDATGETGVVDLTYLGRWGHIANDDNVRSPDLRARLDRAGERGRRWLREHLDPEVIVAGTAAPSQVHVFASGESYQTTAPIESVELVIERIAR